MRRLARFGSGWIPWGPDAADLAAGIARMRHAVSAAGRDPGGIHVLGTLPAVRDQLGRPDLERTASAAAVLADAGVTDLLLRVPLPEKPVEITAFLQDVVSALAFPAAALGRPRPNSREN
jgi:alkanesulfonate monooxygenase SsuD/methylene tetrahydromethanopterin reductase-like flavin-dependent oxidoreductase (luciferase family)